MNNELITPGKFITSVFCLLFSITFAITTYSTVDPAAFSTIGWQLHDSDEDHIDRMIDLAADYGVNHIQLSHSIIMNIDRINEDAARAALIERVARRAGDKGIKTYIWTHEFNTKQMTVCLDPRTKDGREFWSVRRRAYIDALAKVPDVDGVIVSFGSSRPDPWSLFCTCSWCRKHDAGDRVALIVKIIGDVVIGKYHKEFVARTFIHTPRELEWVRLGLIRSERRDGLSVMSKCVPQDWEPYYPNNSLIGAVGGHPQVVEIDLAGEYWGKSAFPADLTEYLQYRIRYARDHGVSGFVARVERGAEGLLGTGNEINLYSFHELMKNPDADPDTLRLQWFEKRFGLKPDSEDAKMLLDIYKHSFDAVRKMYYVLGFWALEKGSDLTTSATYPALLSGRSVALYDPAFKKREAELTHPDVDVYNRIMEEKSEAVAISDRIFDEINNVSGMKESDKNLLRNELGMLKRAAETWRLANGALWAYRLYVESGDPAHLEWSLDFAADLGSYADTLPKNQWPGNTARIAKFLTNYYSQVKGKQETKTSEYVMPGPVARNIEIGESIDSLEAGFITDEKVKCGLRVGTHLMELEPVAETEKELSRTHTIRWSGLEPATRYIFTISCEDDTGTTRETSDYWWVTTLAE